LSSVTPQQDDGAVVGRIQSIGRLWFRRHQADDGSPEESFIQSCLDLASSDDSASTDQLARHFDQIMGRECGYARRIEANPNELRHQLRDAFASYPRKTRITVKESWEPLRGAVVRHAMLISAPDGAPVVSFNIDFRDVEGVIEWLLILLDDPVVGIGKHLRSCALPSCGRRFISKSTSKGGPRRKYCCDDHQELADRHNAKARMAHRRRLLARRRSR
jgi:hypothetical protein